MKRSADVSQLGEEVRKPLQSVGGRWAAGNALHGRWWLTGGEKEVCWAERGSSPTTDGAVGARTLTFAWVLPVISSEGTQEIQSEQN